MSTILLKQKALRFLTAIFLCISIIFNTIAPIVPLAIQEAYAQEMEKFVEEDDEFVENLAVVSGEIAEVEKLTQDFSKGVLSMNSDKDRYLPGQSGELHFGVLDDKGVPVCDAELTLTVTAPDDSIHILSSQNGLIENTGNCNTTEIGFIEPDYRATYNFGEGVGDYKFNLLAETDNGPREITTTIEVSEAPPVIIGRTSATRLFPMGPAPMTIDVEFFENFSG
ncbi:hypothetical protein ACFL21_03960 [Patescibacteria group bacterium]